MSERQQHWEQVYREKAPDAVSWYQPEPRLSLQLIERAVPERKAPIIDVGGGASLLVDRLLERGYSRLTVLDIAEAALAHAKTRLGERAQMVEWQVADVTRLVPPHPYALWHDRAVFHFLTEPADRRRYLEVLNKALPPGGQLVLAAFGIGGPARCSGLEIVQYDAPKPQAELGEGFELVEETVELHLTPAGREQRFGWFRFHRR